MISKIDAVRKCSIRIAFLCSILISLTGCHADRQDQRPKTAAIPTGPIHFTDMYGSSGIDFRLGHNGRTPLNILDTIGHGIALIDVDGDGLLDIVMTGPDRVRLYKNLGNFKFKDITEGSGLRQKGYWTGIAVGDVDGDGRPDLYIAAKGEAALYRNLGGGRFQDMTAQSGLTVTDQNRWNSTAILFDYDHDGRLDLFVGAYVDLGSHSGLCPNQAYTMACGPKDFTAQKGILYHNTGNWHFTPVPLGDLTHGKDLGSIAGDLYGDGGVELYLANDVMEADMLRYVGNGKWKSDGERSGTAFGTDGHMMGGMGVSVADYQDSDRLDLVVGTYSRDPRSLYYNDGAGEFSNQAFQSGIAAACTFYVAFGTEFVDLDNKGLPDLVMANGHVQDQINLVDKQIFYAEPTLILYNEGGGHFADVSAAAGPAINRSIVGRALCIGDLDNDGKIDMVVEDLEGAPLILKNDSPSNNNWIRIKLVGTRASRDGQGAIVTCYTGATKQRRLATTGGSYFSANDPRVHFGLGHADKVDKLVVKWPGGKEQTISAPPVNSEIEVREK